MKIDPISEIINLAIKTDKLSTKTERGQVWQLGLVFNAQEEEKIKNIISKFTENKRKYSLISVKSDAPYWLPHSDFEWVPVKIISDENVDRVTFSKTFSYTIKYFDLNGPDKDRVSSLEKLAQKAQQGIPTGVPPFVIYQRLEEAKQIPLRERVEKIVETQYSGAEKNKIMQNLNEAKICFTTNFLTASERLVASWYVNGVSKVSRLPQGISIFFSNEIYKRADARIHHLIKQATQSNACAGNFFFPLELDDLRKSVTIKKRGRNS